MSERRVKTGKWFMSGNIAIAEGCLSAGCTFFGGYPITPSSEVAEHMAKRLFEVGGDYVQFEDEIASIAGLLGAAWAGAKSMTATSGPGFSLMQENIGLAVMTETPCVIVNIQRGGPSTGLPTLVGQQDIMQAKWGSHGDYQIIALCPNSVQEAYDLCIIAFNLAEKYRTPVVILSDESIGHMSEGITIPPISEITRLQRKKPAFEPHSERYYPYKLTDDTLIPPMAVAGEGYKIFTTGLTHDERGYPKTTPEYQKITIKRINDKIEKNKDDICIYEEFMTEDAEILIVAFGIVSRVAKGAVIKARKMGYKVGLFRPITLWPVVDHAIKFLAEKVNHIIVAEINNGQYLHEVERFGFGKAVFHFMPHYGGSVHTINEFMKKIKQLQVYEVLE